MFDPKNMIYRNLGQSGLRVPVFSYGSWLTIGATQKGDIVKDLMKTAYDNGINMFDTAELYAAGEGEREMGRVIKELGWDRRDIIITAKIFFGTERKEKQNTRGLSRKHLVEGLNQTLKNLQLDYVDIVFAHRADLTTPLEEVVRAFNYLIDSGKAFYWGTSEWSSRQIQQAHEIARRLNMVGPIAEQPHYSMLHRERFESEYEALWKWERMGATVWSPLEAGILTGKYNNGIPDGSRFDTNSGFFKGTVDELQTPAGRAKIEKVKQLTALAENELGCSVSHLALAWTLLHPGVSSTILGATRPEQIIDNLKALDVYPKITPEIKAKIEAILDNKPAMESSWGRRDAEGKLI